MTQLSFDAGKRVPLLDLTPVSKPGRAGADSSDQFDSHLNRASAPPTSPASSTAATASAVSRHVASSSSDSTSPKSAHDESEPEKQSASDTPDPGEKATNSASNTPETGQPHATHSDSDSDPDSDAENDSEGEDDVVLSEKLVVVAQQVAVLEANIGADVDEEAADGVKEVAEGVIEIGQSDKKESKESGHPAQPKPKKPVNQAQQSALSDSGNKSAAPEAVKNPVAPEVQPTEASLDVAETGNLDASLVQEDPIEENASEVSVEMPLSIKQKTTTIRIKDGQTDETIDFVDDQDATSEAKTTDSADEVHPEQTRRPENTATSVRAANHAAEPDSADHTGQQAQEERAALAVSSASVENSSDKDTSGDQQRARPDQQREQAAPSVSGNKPNAGPTSTSESSAVNKQLAPATEAPVLRAEHATSSKAEPSGAETMSAADRARFVHRVYRALHVAHERGGEVRLRLSPPELGNLTLELKLQDGAMTAHIEAETSTARTLLLENVSILKERLAAQGIQVERFDVDLRDQSRQQSPDGQSQDSEAGRNARHVLKKTFMNGAPAEEKRGSPGIRPTTGSEQLNVII